jgi:hypothetical protein
VLRSTDVVNSMSPNCKNGKRTCTPLSSHRGVSAFSLGRFERVIVGTFRAVATGQKCRVRAQIEVCSEFVTFSGAEKKK